MASMSADLVTDCLARLDEAHQNGVITDHSVETMRSWLREPRYAEFAEQLADLIVRAKADFESGIPESFNVLVKELRSLGLNVDLHEAEY